MVGFRTETHLSPSLVYHTEIGKGECSGRFFNGDLAISRNCDIFLAYFYEHCDTLLARNVVTDRYKYKGRAT
jgi:hypothetical protein